MIILLDWAWTSHLKLKKYKFLFFINRNIEKFYYILVLF